MDKEKVKVLYNISPEFEQLDIGALLLKDGTRNALRRVGLNHIGEILENWNKLKDITPPDIKSGIGVAKEKEIHSATFAFLGEMGCVKKLQYEV